MHVHVRAQLMDVCSFISKCKCYNVLQIKLSKMQQNNALKVQIVIKVNLNEFKNMPFDLFHVRPVLKHHAGNTPTHLPKKALKALQERLHLLLTTVRVFTCTCTLSVNNLLLTLVSTHVQFLTLFSAAVIFDLCMSSLSSSSVSDGLLYRVTAFHHLLRHFGLRLFFGASAFPDTTSFNPSTFTNSRSLIRMPSALASMTSPFSRALSLFFSWRDHSSCTKAFMTGWLCVQSTCSIAR